MANKFNFDDLPLSPQQTRCRTVLYAAADEPYGLSVRTDDTFKTMATLKATKTELKDPTLAGITFHISPVDPACSLWILSNRAKAENYPSSEPPPITITISDLDQAP